MHKIESEMLAAIRDGRNWQSGNTQVTHYREDNYSYIYLHGNCIAKASFGLMVRAIPNFATFRQYPTRTTVSRLRALGINACVKKGVPMIDGEPV